MVPSVDPPFGGGRENPLQSLQEIPRLTVLILQIMGMLMGVDRASTGFEQISQMPEVGQSLDISQSIEHPLTSSLRHERTMRARDYCNFSCTRHSNGCFLSI